MFQGNKTNLIPLYKMHFSVKTNAFEQLPGVQLQVTLNNQYA